MSPKDTPVRKAINCIVRIVICRAANQRLISREKQALSFSTRLATNGQYFSRVWPMNRQQAAYIAVTVMI